VGVWHISRQIDSDPGENGGNMHSQSTEFCGLAVFFLKKLLTNGKKYDLIKYVNDNVII
jgi:hypothetical protein